MKEKRLLYIALAVAAIVSMGQTMGIRNDGLQFPDRSVQTTAATIPQSWPYQCFHLGFLEADETLDMTCFSNLSEAPAAWGGGSSGVPEGWVFLATDFVVEPIEGGATTGQLYLQLLQREFSNPAYVVLDIRKFHLVGDLPTTVYSSEAPMLALAPDHYLQVQSRSGSTVLAEVRVYGFMTTDPSRLGR